MPRFSTAVPKYRRHKTGQAVVTLAGRDIYLGKYGTEASRQAYDRRIAEWIQGGRRLAHLEVAELSVVHVLTAYLKQARKYYVKNGKQTREVGCLVEAAIFVQKLYGHTPADDFGPLALRCVQQAMVDAGLSRGVVNKQLGRVKRIFKWAVSEELVSPTVYHALATVPGLRRGRTAARETDPVKPVSGAIVDQTLEHLSPILADMVRFQLLTGCRPGEVCMVRPGDVDRSSDVWAYRPETHKTEHRGRERVIFIGPKAQAILRPYLLREDSAYCFSPAESERDRRSINHEQRITPMSCGNRPGTNQKRKPKRQAGHYYTSGSYRRAVHRACDAAFPSPQDLDDKQTKRWKTQHRWSPNQLRHTTATDLRKRFGLEAAQVALGHAKADVTQIYAERDLEKAAEIMRSVG